MTDGDDYRVEEDRLGGMQVPADAYWGAQTQRAAENLPVSGLTFGRRFVRALGVVIRCSTKRSLVRLAELCSAAFDTATPDRVRKSPISSVRRGSCLIGLGNLRFPAFDVAVPR